ncbi:ShlB/FhaC/HecB family hemolysin secretion/activation protein [Polaromonas glacialis]|uniref:ShlB/FhaC/HecB family hemolysin secretion/activation protein n=1 Tax=Polaromonas glacialis TaxID=866564 RepID=UPI000495562D|nr:ShlB/FhaC/HecB family hemolysin secretion/activation protein [Polaromonas glacialis]
MRQRLRSAQNSTCRILVSAAFGTSGIAQAQVPPVIPPAGRIEQEVRPALEPIRRSIQIEAPRPSDQVPAGADTVQFVLGSVELKGNQALSIENLRDLWVDRIGKSITLADAFRIAAAISARYREAGYILSQAIVPRQELLTERATLQIEVLEGYVDQVTFSGADNLKDALAPYASKITAERPLTLATLERNLLLMNELAGLSVRANLKASATPGATSMDLSLARDPAAFSVSVHNRSSKALGRVRAEASADMRGVFGHFDRHTFRFITSGSQRLNYLGYAGEQPIGHDGLKLNWNASASKSEPQLNIPLNIDSNSSSAGVGVSYPVIRSRARNLDVRARLDASHNSSNIPLETRDDIRALRAGATLDSLDSFGGLNIADLEVSKGLSALGASRRDDTRLSRNGLADPQFSKVTYYLARLQSITGPWSVLVAASGQHSRDVLVTSETFGLGGDVFLRAFDPSELFGDNGIAGKIELRFDLPQSAFRSTFYAYHDAGKVRFNTPNDRDQSILSTGAGVRFSAAQGVRGYIEVSKPRHKIPNSTGSNRLRVFAGAGIDF